MSINSGTTENQARKLDLLVQNTLKTGKKLSLQTILADICINNENAKKLMSYYVNKGICHYNPKQQTYFPNTL